MIFKVGVDRLHEALEVAEGRSIPTRYDTLNKPGVADLLELQVVPAFDEELSHSTPADNGLLRHFRL